MELKDLLGVGKTIEALLNSISNATGVLYEPTRIKRKAKADMEALGIKTDKISKLLESNPDATALTLLNESNSLEIKNIDDVFGRAIAANEFKSLSEQRTLEEIVARSLKYLQPTDGTQKIEKNWTTRFINKSKEISHEDMKDVWSRVLAGEINKPGSFSLRSLETLSNLSQNEAEIFRKIVPYATSNYGFVFLPEWLDGGKNFTKGLSLTSIMILQDAGLAKMSSEIEVSHELKPSTSKLFPYIHGTIKVENNSDRECMLKMEILCLTTTGIELMKLIDPCCWDDDYLERLQKEYKNVKFIYKQDIT